MLGKKSLVSEIYDELVSTTMHAVLDGNTLQYPDYCTLYWLRQPGMESMSAPPMTNDIAHGSTKFCLSMNPNA